MADNILTKDRDGANIALAAKDVSSVLFPRNILTDPSGNDVTPLTDAQLRTSAVPVSVAALPLPAGAATQTTLATLLTDTQLRATAVPVSAASLSSLDTKAPAKGTAAMAGSTPVTFATDDTQIGAKITAATLGAGGSGLIGWLSDIALACKGIVLAAGSAVIGKVGIDQTTPGTTNGVQLTAVSASTNATSTALEASRVVKASAGTLFCLTLHNNSVSAQYYQLHDAASLPADAAVPKAVIRVPAGASASMDYGLRGRPFTTGIVVCNSSTLATKTIGSADSWFDAQYT